MINHDEHSGGHEVSPGSQIRNFVLQFRDGSKKLQFHDGVPYFSNTKRHISYVEAHWFLSFQKTLTTEMKVFTTENIFTKSVNSPI